MNTSKGEGMSIEKLLFSDPASSILKKGLDVEMMRNSVIASNIANVDTPDYKAKNINFEKTFQDALGSQGQIKMSKTNSKHISPGIETLKSSQPEIEIESDPSRPDGNNVNIDKEMTKLADVQLGYEALITAMQKRGGIIKHAINDGKG